MKILGSTRVPTLKKPPKQCGYSNRSHQVRNRLEELPDKYITRRRVSPGVTSSVFGQTARKVFLSSLADSYFFFRPSSDKFVSRRMPKLHELMIPEGTVLLSRSGTRDIPHSWANSAKFAVTDDALRVFAGSAPVGFTYAFLSCSFAQALITKSEYGKVVSHIEAKHIAAIPVPKVSETLKSSIHAKVVQAFALRDEANETLTAADDLLQQTSRFDRL